MKKTIITFLILTLLGGFGYYFFSEPVQPLGSAVTTILGTDKMSASRSVINTNFASLNSGKMEVSTTTLPLITTLSALDTVGALKSGSLTTGFTVINVAQGGTGASTLLSNQVLLGNGTSAINKVSGFGTTGQFLTSNGASVAPTWQTSAVDVSIDYDWTGYHTFTDALIASSTITTLKNTTFTTTTGSITNLTSSGTQTLNGIEYTFPATESASSTVLSTDGSGGLTWKTMQTITVVTGTVSGSNMSGNFAQGTKTATCPAGTKVVGGGGTCASNCESSNLLASYPSSATVWTATWQAIATGGSASFTAGAYAVCISQ